MKQINRNLYPKNGYRFKESDGAYIYGNTWNGVIARVKEYRNRAKYPPGNPEVEVINQACAENPGYCSELTEVERNQRREVALKTRVLSWLTVWRSKDDKAFVPVELAQQRASICATCPNNRALPGGCASCRAAVEELRRNTIGRRPVDGRLNACVILGEDLPSSAHLEQQTVENAELPGNCWRKRTL